MEFNINDFSNYDVNAFNFDGEPGRYPSSASLGQSFFVNSLKNWPLATTLLVMVAGGFGDFLSEREGCNYLRAEGFEVIAASSRRPFEEIRWQQPEFVLVNNNPQLVQRLQHDPLTQQISVIALTAQLAPDYASDKVIYAQNFQQLAKAVEFFQKAQCQEQNAVLLPRKNQSDKANWSNARNAVAITQKFLRDPELRFLIAEIVTNWTTLQVVAYLSDDTASTINQEQLINCWGLGSAEANQVIKKLACAGLIEPLELEADIPDPFYAVVAHPEQLQLLQKFAQALNYQFYRVALTTYLLGR